METLPAMGRGPGGSALEEKAGRWRGGEEADQRRAGRRPSSGVVGRRSGGAGHWEEVVRRICGGIRVVFFFWAGRAL